MCMPVLALGKYTFTTFFSPIRDLSSLSTCSGFDALLMFLAMRTKQFFLAIIEVVSFSLVGVGDIISPSTTTADCRIWLQWSKEVAIINACSCSMFFKTCVISNSLFLLKLSMIMDSNNLWASRLDSVLFAILRVNSSLAATLSSPLEILAMVVSSSNSSTNMRVPSNRVFLSISGLLRWTLVMPFHASFFKLHRGAMGSHSLLN